MLSIAWEFYVLPTRRFVQVNTSGIGPERYTRTSRESLLEAIATSGFFVGMGELADAVDAGGLRRRCMDTATFGGFVGAGFVGA